MYSQTTFQAGEIQLTSGQSQEMDSFFYDYTAFDFDTYQLNSYVKASGDNVSFTIYVNDTLTWNFQLKERDVTSGNFMLMYTNAAGERFVSHKDETNTYQGYVNNAPENTAFFYISKDKIKGEFTAGGIDYVIEPGNVFTQMDGFIVYQREKRKADPDFGPAISVRSTPCTGPGYPDCSCYSIAYNSSNWIDDSYYLELAFEMDCEFVRDNIWEPGMVEVKELKDAVEDFIDYKMMKISKAYEDAVNMQVIAVFVHFWMPELNENPLISPTCVASADPYLDDNNAPLGLYWKEFREYWNENFSFVNRDWAHVFSGLNLGGGMGVASGGQYSPFSGASSICGADDPIYQPPSAPYNFQSYAVSDKDADWTTVAHEMGHGFGLAHTHGCNTPKCNHPWATCTLMEDCCSERLACFSYYPCEQFNCDNPSTKLWPHNDTEHHNLCRYLNGYNGTLNRDKNICLLDPPPSNFEFDILLEDEQAIQIEDDLICLNEEIKVTFFYSFNLSNFSWDIGPGLSLITGTVNNPAITLKGTSNGVTSQICANFDYNGQTLTFCRNIHIGIPLPPGVPIIKYYSNNYTPYFSVGFPTSTYASFFEYSYVITDNIGNPSDYSSGTTPTPNPIASPVYPGQCVRITIKSGNECGVNPFTLHDPFYNCFQGQGLMAPPTGINSSVQGEKFNSIEKPMLPKRLLIENDQFFKIYPNPSSGQFNLILPAYNDISELRIIDMAGKVACEQEIVSVVRQIELNLNDLATGTYKVQLIQGDRIFQEKLKIIR